jgi:hypothetical protein
VAIAKQGPAGALTVCSSAFETLGRAQAKAMGHADLAIGVVPHPFGLRDRAGIRELAETFVDDIARLACSTPADEQSALAAPAPAPRAPLVDVADNLETFNALCRDRRWGDGLPLIPPTPERVQRMLMQTRRAPDEVVGLLAPGFGAASVERIAINGVLAGCEPHYMPVLIAAAKAISNPRFNLQGIQATTNPVAVWLIVNGPIAKTLGINGSYNCLGQGTWANATLGRAIRLMLQNIGGALPGAMDRATHGQPAKYTFCCAENEVATPWEPVHVERGFRRDQSTVTVVGISGTVNMNTHAKDAADLLRIVGDTLAQPASNDYWVGGEPWIVFPPEHAHILERDGLTKAEVKRRIWEHAKMAAGRMAAKDLARTANARRAELGEIGPETLLPPSTAPDDIGILVAGGPGTHAVCIPSYGNMMRSVTCEVLAEI